MKKLLSLLTVAVLMISTVSVGASAHGGGHGGRHNGGGNGTGGGYGYNQQADFNCGLEDCPLGGQHAHDGSGYNAVDGVCNVEGCTQTGAHNHHNATGNSGGTVHHSRGRGRHHYSAK